MPTTGSAPAPPDAWDRSSLFFLPAVVRAAITVLPSLLGDPLAFLTRVAREHGDIACVGVMPRTYLLSHPDFIKHVLQDNHQNYVKGQSYAFLKKVLGSGLLAADGEDWRRHRRLVQPAFHRDHHRMLALAMRQGIDGLCERWDRLAGTGESVNLREEMVALTLDILMRSLFSTDLRDEAVRLRAAFLEADSHIDLTASVMPVHLPVWVPTPRNRRFRRAMATLDGFIYGVIRSRRATRTPPADLLSLLVGARDEDTHASLGDEELRDEVIAVMHGGYEPLSDALTWAGYVLSQQPPVARPLEAELSAVLGHRAPTFEDLPALGVTSLLIQEILRLYPPAWGIGRTALADDTIGGYRVPAGSLVVLSPWVVHRDARWWEAPDTCDPERFSPERSANRHRLAYFPFAAGPRMCIGRDFAMMEAGLILASLWQRYRLELRSGAPLRPVARYGLEPSAPMLMRIIRRSSAA